MRLLFYILVSIGLLTNLTVRAQYYSTGQDPSSVRWYTVRQGPFSLILPDSLVFSAGSRMRTLEMAFLLNNQDLKTSHPGVPVILHHQSILSNAYVSWAPARMEFYMIPPRNAYPEDWFLQLALHEGRHFLQMSSLRQGIGKPLSLLFGQQYTGLMTGLFLPRWFLEGDAVYAETFHGKSGRGSQSSFSAELLCQLSEFGIPSYDKAVLGSYACFIPDAYVLGYHLVSYGREMYGPEFWPSVLRKTARYPFMVMPFAAGIRNFHKTGKDGLYRSAMLDLLKKAKQNIPESRRTRQDYRSYSSPVASGTDTLYAIRTSLDFPPGIVEITAQKETRLRFPGTLNGDALQGINGRIYWTEQQPDLRWENRGTSNIHVFDIRNRKHTRLTRNHRYFSPVPSPDGTLLAAVEFNNRNLPSIAWLNASDGRPVKSTRIFGVSNILNPVFDDSGSRVLITVSGEAGNSLAFADSTGGCHYILPFTRLTIADICIHRGRIFLISNPEGSDQIYELDTLNGFLYRISDEPFGISGLHSAGTSDSLISSVCTSDGWKIRFIGANRDKNKKILINNFITDEAPVLNYTIERKNFILPDFEAGSREIKRYRKLKHLFNFHSYAPLFVDVEGQEADPGISFMSQNLLSTSFVLAGYRYSLAEGSGKTVINWQYEGFYPKIGIGFESGNRIIRRSEGSEEIDAEWREDKLTFTLLLPLNFSRSSLFSRFTPFVRTSLFQTSGYTDTLLPGFRGYYQSMDYGLTWYGYRRSSERDLFPRLGIWIGAQYRHTPFSGIRINEVAGVQSYLYLPGLFRHHGLRIGLSIQSRKAEERFVFSDVISTPAGFRGYTGERFWAISPLYRFPFWYPDLSIPAILYVKRFSGGFHYTRAEYGSPANALVYQDWGAELRMQFHLFRIFAPIEIGVRYTLTEGSSVPDWQFTWQFQPGQRNASNSFQNLHREMHNF